MNILAQASSPVNPSPDRSTEFPLSVERGPLPHFLVYCQRQRNGTNLYALHPEAFSLPEQWTVRIFRPYRPSKDHCLIRQTAWIDGRPRLAFEDDYTRGLVQSLHDWMAITNTYPVRFSFSRAAANIRAGGILTSFRFTADCWAAIAAELVKMGEIVEVAQ